jgi:hypothetical protein
MTGPVKCPYKSADELGITERERDILRGGEHARKISAPPRRVLGTRCRQTSTRYHRLGSRASGRAGVQIIVKHSRDCEEQRDAIA